ALGAPLYKLWGGFTDRLKSICIAGYYEEGKTLADFGSEMERIRADGHAGCKFKVGGKTPKEDAERVRVARKAAGDDFILIVDANQGWTLRQAVEFSRLAADLRIRWFEEPVRWYNDRLNMAAARNQTGIPICAGQSEISSLGCRDLMMAGAIDVCNFDASWGGGPTEWRRVAAMAQSYNVGVAQHIEPQIGAMLVTGARNGTFAEALLPWRDPVFDKLIADQKPFNGGKSHISDQP